jgi:hypothetical protein
MTSGQRRARAVLERRLSDRGDPERMEKAGGSALSAPQHRRKARVWHTVIRHGPATATSCGLTEDHIQRVESSRTPSWVALEQKSMVDGSGAGLERPSRRRRGRRQQGEIGDTAGRSLIPTFAVPLWIIIHMASLLQLRQARA